MKVIIFDTKVFGEISLGPSQKIVLTRTPENEFFMSEGLYKAFKRDIDAELKSLGVKLPEAQERTRKSLIAQPLNPDRDG